MNLRQKYKKAKKELEFYRRQKMGNYTLVKREELNVQTLQRKMVVDPRNVIPKWVLENRIRDELASDIRGFITVEHRSYNDEHIICASIKVVDQSPPAFIGKRAKVCLVDETPHSYFQQLYATDTDEEDSSFTKEPYFRPPVIR